MSYFLAVDAGGTKTEFLLADEKREIARVFSGTIKRLRVDAETTERHLRQALAELTEKTGIAMSEIACSCVGTSGETAPLVADWLRDAFGRLVGGKLLLLGDVEIALDACFYGERGMLILAGTGSNIAARMAHGSIETAGGWGPAMADQGSGHTIGLMGLRRGFYAIDTGRQTRLLEEAIRFWKLGSLGELIELGNANPAPIFSDFTPVVTRLASEGDEVALEVLQWAGEDIGRLALVLIERMRRLEASALSSSLNFVPPAIAVAGSILTHVAPVRAALEATLRAEWPQITVQEAVADPVLGALWRARLGQ